MKLLPVMVLLAVLLSQQVSPSEGFKIATFNIQQLGPRKIGNARFANPLVNFICSQDWDIVFLQELTSEAVLNILVNKLNTNGVCKRKGQYSEVHSIQLPVGLRRAAGKEIYAYLYRKNKVSHFTAAVRQEQIAYHVNGQNFPADVFFRPPFVAKVQVNTAVVPELACMSKFALIGIHTRPVRTYSEVNGLVHVYDWARQQISENALILGDLNADCGTFGRVEKQHNILYQASHFFKWLVNDRVKTNPGSRKNCAYDRLIAAGTVMWQTALQENVQVPQWTGLRLSDHWPVSIDLKCPSTQRGRSRSRSPRSRNRRSRSRGKRGRSP